MLKLVDIVNWNADASCLSADRWLTALDGGAESEFCGWLRLYVEFQRPVCLGLTGPTLADLYELNPEALALVRSHPQIFSFVRRPFAHDIGLLRTAEGLACNIDYGARAMRLALGCVPDAYLAPEFMCNAMQVSALVAAAVRCTFIHPSRFDAAAAAAANLPRQPYPVRGLFDDTLPCVPFLTKATEAYLDALHRLDSSHWNECLAEVREATAYTWRDGESAFLLPDSLLRERRWLSQESGSVQRIGWQEAAWQIEARGEPRAYPIHPFSAWIREMKTYWYLADLRDIERNLVSLGPEQLHLWLLAINSDILSSIEKRSPQVRLVLGDGSHAHFEIRRQEKCTDGEECLALIRGAHSDLGKQSSPSRRLRRARLSFLQRLAGRHE